MKNILRSLTSFTFVLAFISICSAQENIITPDLSKIVKKEGWKIFNRNVSSSDKDSSTVVHLDGQKDDGLVWLENYEFNNGTIEVDIRGKDVSQGSFVGIAFRGVDEKTYDAVYFRPFNFMSNDSVRKSHSVQYVSQPTNTWQKLRSETPGKFENCIVPTPDPNSFFHVKIVIEKPKVRVFVNGSNEPCLVVGELSVRTGGWVGLWAGNYSEGTFKNFKIDKKD